MQNFAQAFEQLAASRNDSPLSFHRFAAISVCAAALGNRVYIDSDWARIFPAMWICFVGQSKVHKTTAINFAAKLLAQAYEGVELPQTFSAEAIIEHLAQRPYGLLRWAEMGVGLEFLAKDYANGTISAFCDLWDAEPVTRLTKGSGYVRVENAALSVLAGGKQAWFMKFAKSRQNVGMSVGTGFFGRWLFVLEEAPNGWHGMFERADWNAADREVSLSLIEHLKRLVEFEGEIAPGPGSLVIDAWLKEFEPEWNDDTDPAEFSRRAGAQVAKLAIGIQAALGTSWLGELHEKPVKQAIGYWLYAFESGRKLVDLLVGQSEDADELQRFDRALVELGGATSQRALLRKLRVSMTRFMLFASTLVEQGCWEREETPNEGARPTVFWRRK